MSKSKSVDERIGEMFDETFPFDDPREHQRPVSIEAYKGFEEEPYEVVALDAPPGFGKSGVIWTVLDMVDKPSFYGTPLKSLQDQLIEDDVLQGMVEIKGRNNYLCHLPEEDEGTTVDVAKCQRESGFECPMKDSCTYYSQKHKALSSEKTVMNLSYLMAEGMVDPAAELSFGDRTVIVIDECQSIEDWALNFVGFTISKRTVPDDVWRNISFPRKNDAEDYEHATDWVRDDVYPRAREILHHLESTPSKSKDGVVEQSRLSQFVNRVERFLTDEQDHEWTSSYDVSVNKNGPNYKSVKFTPINVGRFLHDLVWSRADYIFLASATIPRGNWFQDIGLADKNIKRLNVESTFPVENRPIITKESVGKMSLDNQDMTMPKMVHKVKLISDHHEGKGLIHCRAYKYIEKFKRSAYNNGFRDWYDNNFHIQDRDNREESLEEWVNNDKQVFMSVNMAEGIDLKGDKCRWQVLLKTNFPSLADERNRHILYELGDRERYIRDAVVQLEQAYGRAVRSEDDEAVFYILDDSAVNLIKDESHLFHGWFREALDINV